MVWLYVHATYINTHLILVHKAYSQFPEITNTMILTVEQQEENPISTFPQKKKYILE